MRFKAVFFDLDGTLVNSTDDLANASNFAIKSFGFKEQPIENYKTYANNGAMQMLERAIYPNKLEKEKMDKMLETFFDYYKDHCHVFTKPYDGIEELIKYLKQNDIKIACITNKIQSIAVSIIDYFFGGFDVTVGQFGNRPIKPEPDEVNFALEKLGVKKSEVLYLGDSNVDIATAKNSSLTMCGVSWGFGGLTKEDCKNIEYVAYSTKEIMEIINEA